MASICSPRDEPFRHDLFFAQALSLLRGGFRFWFSRDEIREIQKIMAVSATDE